ncbi:MAG: reverse transcriptase domain-containing protein [Candidatus Methanoperedens sp.]
MCPSLVDKLDFELAVKQVIVDSNTDFIIDKLGIEILKEFKDNFIDHLKNKITKFESKSAEYEPLPLEIINVPKKDFTMRPGAVPEIIDRIYYQALCNAIAPAIEQNLTKKENNVVFSYRLSNKKGDEYMFIEPGTAYNNFISYQNSICENNGFSYVLETDIADYFERIYHHNLINLLDGFGCDNQIVVALSKLLRTWTEGISYGIPQGMWPSDLLGNAYLHDLDVAMISDNYKYIRYVDDIRIFCDSELMAKKALMEISQIIRPMGLNIQPAKTYIHEKDFFCTRVVTNS